MRLPANGFGERRLTAGFGSLARPAEPGADFGGGVAQPQLFAACNCRDAYDADSRRLGGVTLRRDCPLVEPHSQRLECGAEIVDVVDLARRLRTLD